MTTVPAVNAPVPPFKKPRDPRLDFFRGLAMFIILLAHTPGNTWTLWIPARFGFSDGADIFVFCSGMASALAFGAIFTKRSWWLGTARIMHRMWQVYWAHIGVFLVTAMMLWSIDHFGVGMQDNPYINSPYVVPLFSQTGEALLGLFTLTYVPGLFDILPMYIVILGMIPALMLLHRIGGIGLAAAAVLILWSLANLAGWARELDTPETLNGVQTTLYSIGSTVSFLNLPSNPFGDGKWFFNPFAWQLVFFTGFALGNKWLPVPPVNRTLIWIAALYVLIVIPFAWFKIHRGLYLPDDWLIQDFIENTRAAIRPLWWKSEQGFLRYLHLMALVYLAWVIVGRGGVRLLEGFRAPRVAGPVVLTISAIVFVLTIPYTYVEWIMTYLPWLNTQIVWLLDPVATQYLGTNLFVDETKIGMLEIAHMVAAILLLWAVIGQRARAWITDEGVRAVVPVIQKVGTQSLAVFMVSIPLSRFDGFVLDHLGREPWSWWLVNCSGMAVLIGVAYGVGWLKSQPWRVAPTPQKA